MCPPMCPPKPSKPHQIRKEYYPPKPRAEGSNPSAPAKLKALKLRGFKAFFVVYNCRHGVNS